MLVHQACLLLIVAPYVISASRMNSMTSETETPVTEPELISKSHDEARSLLNPRQSEKDDPAIGIPTSQVEVASGKWGKFGKFGKYGGYGGYGGYGMHGMHPMMHRPYGGYGMGGYGMHHPYGGMGGMGGMGGYHMHHHMHYPPPYAPMGGLYFPWRGDTAGNEPMPLFLGAKGSNTCNGGEPLIEEGACKTEAARQFGTIVKLSTESDTQPPGCMFNSEHSFLAFNSNNASKGSHARMIPVCLQHPDPNSVKPNPLHLVYLGEINTTECPGGAPLTDENKCRTDAVKKLGARANKFTSKVFSGAPSGCFYNAQHSIVLFNTDLTSTPKPNKRVMPVCAASETSVPTEPTE